MYSNGLNTVSVAMVQTLASSSLDVLALEHPVKQRAKSATPRIHEIIFTVFFIKFKLLLKNIIKIISHSYQIVKFSIKNSNVMHQNFK